MLSEKDILDFTAELKEKSEANNFEESISPISVKEAWDGGVEETVEEMAASHLLPAERQRLRPMKMGAHAKCFPQHPHPKLLHIFKINKSIFLIIHKKTTPLKIDLKCDPKLAKLLKTRHETVQPSQQLGNQGIEIILTGQLPKEDIKDLITHSYHQALKKSN